MFYEGIVEIIDDIINIDLKPQSDDPSLSHYTLQMVNDTEDLSAVMSNLRPQFDPDETPEDSKSYVAGLQKQGFGTFYADSLNVLDLQRIYKSTPPYIPAPFPGMPAPVSKGEIVFTETVPKFTGYVNKTALHEKTVEFKYRRRIR